MDALTKERPQIEALGSETDDALHALIERAKSLLADRQAQRRRQAVAEIQRLAREHGLDVAVKKPAGKRGRPPKANDRAR